MTHHVRRIRSFLSPLLILGSLSFSDQAIAGGPIAVPSAEDLVRCATISVARAAAESGDKARALRRAAGSYFLAARSSFGGIDSDEALSALLVAADSAAAEIEASMNSGEDETVEQWVIWCAAQSGAVDAIISGR